MTTKHIEHVYDYYARIYDRLFGWVLRSGPELASTLQLYPGAKMLDVGVGTGLSLPLWSQQADLVGIDLSEKMLEQARKRVRTLGMSNVKLMKMDATHLNFPDASFDRVLAAYFISTVPDPIRVVQEMKRVCRPGGYLVFCNHFQSDHPLIAFAERLISPICSKIGFRTDLNLHQLMRDTGLEIDIQDRVDSLGFWKIVRCLNP